MKENEKSIYLNKKEEKKIGDKQPSKEKNLRFPTFLFTFGDPGLTKETWTPKLASPSAAKQAKSLLPKTTDLPEIRLAEDFSSPPMFDTIGKAQWIADRDVI